MSLQNSLRQQLGEGVNALCVELTDGQLDKLVQYVVLLAKWNKTYNLTAIKEPEQMVSRHILDSISIAPYITSARILDVGSGPGLPGIPLAILYPDKQIATLDSNGKKTRFMTQAKTELDLANLTVINDRVESYSPEQLFDEVTSRAFSSLVDMVEGTRHLLSESGVYLAMKGLYPEEELSELMKQTNCELVKSITLKVPGNEGTRHLLILSKK